MYSDKNIPDSKSNLISIMQHVIKMHLHSENENLFSLSSSTGSKMMHYGSLSQFNVFLRISVYTD